MTNAKRIGPTPEEYAAFKRQEMAAAKAIMAGDRYCPDPSAHEAEARAATPPALDDLLPAMAKVRGAHNGDEPCGWCRLAAEQAIEALRLSAQATEETPR